MVINAIKRMFAHSFEKEWFETYWAFDLHGTIIKPNYKKGDTSVEYYPFAKETLQLLSKRPDIKMILWTSSYPEEIDHYISKFESDDIHFDAINKNPGISSKNGNFGYYEDKFYFNVLFDDKAGFNPDEEWPQIYYYMMWCKDVGYMPNNNWTTKY